MRITVASTGGLAGGHQPVGVLDDDPSRRTEAGPAGEVGEVGAGGEVGGGGEVDVAGGVGGAGEAGASGASSAASEAEAAGASVSTTTVPPAAAMERAASLIADLEPHGEIGADLPGHRIEVQDQDGTRRDFVIVIDAPAPVQTMLEELLALVRLEGQAPGGEGRVRGAG